MESYQFNQRIYKTIPALANAMGASWNDGRAFLLNGGFRNQIKNTDKALANSCAYLEKKYRDNPKKGNLFFLQWLVKMPGVRNLYWMGENYGNLDHICALMKFPMREDTRKLLLLMVQEQILSDFVKNSGRQELTVSNVRYLEHCYTKSGTKFNRANIFALLLVVLKEEKSFKFDGEQFHSVQDLSAHLQKYADRSKELLSSKISGLFQNDANFTPTFEGWLLNLGYQKELTLWKDRFQAGSSGDIDDDTFVDFEEAETKKQAKDQNNSDFSQKAKMFDVEFTKMMKQYPEVLSDNGRFKGMLKDFFPGKDLQVFLIESLFKMDVVKAINDAPELNDIFASRFIKRMITDFGVKEDFAKWAVSIWCICYGEKILNKRNRVSLYDVM